MDDASGPVRKTRDAHDQQDIVATFRQSMWNRVRWTCAGTIHLAIGYDRSSEAQNEMIKTITMILVLGTPAAFAQQGGTDQERDACSPDVKRYCVPVINQGDLVVLSCLQQNRPKLSPACNKVLVDHGQ
jgi:hypothetical protein